MSPEQDPKLKIFIDDINTDCEDPFQEDTLARKELADNLTGIINAIEGKRVLALNGPWGSGKTTFIDMWRKAHEKKTEQEFTIIYFDAFRHDYYADPFIAISGAITEVLKSDVEEFADKAAGVAKNLLPAVLTCSKEQNNRSKKKPCLYSIASTSTRSRSTIYYKEGGSAGNSG